MKSAAVLAILVVLGPVRASGHRLDEYLQATTIAVDRQRVDAEIRLTPGTAVLPYLLKGIDTNGDGGISAAEERAYATRVLRDLSLRADGQDLYLRLVSSRFPGVQQMGEGRGEIVLAFTADLPAPRSKRTLVFENHHETPIAAYLVNCLVPSDPDIRVTGQNRNYEQSFYELEYSQKPVWWRGDAPWIALLGMLLSTRLAVSWWQRRSDGLEDDRASVVRAIP